MAQIVKKIGDKEVGFKFTMLTIRKYCEMRGITFNEYDKDMSENVFISSNTLFRAAVDVWSKGERNLTEYEMDDLLEDMTQQDYADILKCYSDGMVSALSLVPTKSNNKQASKKK